MLRNTYAVISPMTSSHVTRIAYRHPYIVMSVVDVYVYYYFNYYYYYYYSLYTTTIIVEVVVVLVVFVVVESGEA